MNEAKGSNWYEKWHITGHHRIVHWGIFIIIIALSYAVLAEQINKWAESWSQPDTIVRLARPQAQLVLNPQTQSLIVGESFSAEIILDTANKPIDGVDIYSLHYDPTLLKVIDDVPNQKGIQIEPGEIMPVNAANIVDESTGTIKFGQNASGGGSFTGKGVLATIHFKTLATGTAFLTFDFSQGSTVDSNAAYKGKDQLARVVDAIFTIQPKK